MEYYYITYKYEDWQPIHRINKYGGVEYYNRYRRDWWAVSYVTPEELRKCIKDEEPIQMNDGSKAEVKTITSEEVEGLLMMMELNR